MMYWLKAGYANDWEKGVLSVWAGGVGGEGGGWPAGKERKREIGWLGRHQVAIIFSKSQDSLAFHPASLKWFVCS